MTELNSKNLKVSHNGSDDSGCGIDIPRHTLWYTLAKRARDDDIVMIQADYSKIPKGFGVEKPCPLLKNVTLVGINGKPIITGDNLVLQPFLFDDKAEGTRVIINDIQINVLNIWFKRVGIIKVDEPSATLKVRIYNCTVSGVADNDTIRKPIIYSSARMSFLLIKDSSMDNVSEAAFFNSPSIQLRIENSKILNELTHDYRLGCPEFVVVGLRVYLLAQFFKSRFRRIFIMDLLRKKHKSSKISIFNCTFDDKGVKLHDNQCHSGIRLRNTNLSIANTYFLNIRSSLGMLYIFSSVAYFRECNFSRIESQRSSLLTIALNGSVSFSNCHFEQNVALGKSGTVLFSSSQSWFENCTFQSNSAIGLYGQGGTITSVAQSFLSIQRSIFKWNNSTYKGGAIYLQESQGLIRNCTFKSNTVNNRGRSGYASGGAIHQYLSILTIQQSTFKKNKSTYIGGAICNSGSMSSVKRTHVRNITESNFESDADSKIFFTKDQYDLIISRCLFEENYAERSGGAIFRSESRLYINASRFEWNTAGITGGAISQYGTSSFGKYIGADNYTHTRFELFITCTRFERNGLNKVKYGGPLYINKRSKVMLLVCNLKGNTATRAGGAIFHNGDTLYAINTTFETNSVLKSIFSSGGAIFTRKQSAMELVLCRFQGNNATYGGGATMHFGTTLSIKYTAFENNIAHSSF